MPTVHEDRVDGLTTFWVETTPPHMAALVFRVGHWDETVLTRGITHLVEHLAFYPLKDHEVDSNGFVTGSSTSFWAVGTPDRLQGFFGDLCRSLRSLPIDRLEAEAQVLRAEMASQQATIGNVLLRIFFGPNGPGLLGYHEHGIDLVGPKEAQVWADRCFTRENAVLVLVGPSRPDLEIDLPAGEYLPFRAPGPDVGYRPRHLEVVGGQEGGICLGAIAERTAETAMAWELLEHRLLARLRHDLGLVYGVSAVYLPLDADSAFLYAGVEATEDRLRETAAEFLRVVRAFQTDEPPRPDELERLRRGDRPTEEVDAAMFARNEAMRVAHNRLLAYEEVDLEELWSEREGLTPSGVQEAFRTAVDQAAVIAPHPLSLHLPKRVPRAFEPVRGKRFMARGSLSEAMVGRLIIGPEGLSGWCEHRWVTLHWRDVVLATRSEFNEWGLLGRTGVWLTIDPARWWRRRRITELLTENVPAGIVLPRSRGE